MLLYTCIVSSIHFACTILVYIPYKVEALRHTWLFSLKGAFGNSNRELSRSAGNSGSSQSRNTTGSPYASGSPHSNHEKNRRATTVAHREDIAVHALLIPCLHLFFPLSVYMSPGSKNAFSKNSFSKSAFSKNAFSNILQFFGGLVLGCIKTKFCKKICVRQHFSRSTRFASFCTAAISKFSQKISLKNQQFS